MSDEVERRGPGAPEKPVDIDAALERIAAGDKMTAIADAAGVSRMTLYRKLNHPDVIERLAAARAASAEVFIDRADVYLDDAAAEGKELTTAQASIARHRSDLSFRLAQLRNPEYADRGKVDVGVTFDFGSAFMAALEAHGKRPAGELRPVQDAEYSLLDDDDDDSDEDEEDTRALPIGTAAMGLEVCSVCSRYGCTRHRVRG